MAIAGSLREGAVNPHKDRGWLAQWLGASLQIDNFMFQVRSPQFKGLPESLSGPGASVQKWGRNIVEGRHGHCAMAVPAMVWSFYI